MKFKKAIDNDILELENEIKALDKFNSRDLNNEKSSIEEIKKVMEKLKNNRKKSRFLLEVNFSKIKNDNKSLGENLKKIENIFLEKVAIIPEAPLHERIERIFNKIIKLNDSIEELRRISILVNFSSDNKNYIIVGGNGSGKSTLADYLKESVFSNVIVFPAQKHLYVEEEPYNRDITISLEELQNNQKNLTAKNINDEYNNHRKYFSELITSIINEHINQLHIADNKKIERKESNYDKMKIIFEKLNPDLNVDLDTNKRTIKIQNRGNVYNINKLSDGEKVILFYIAEVLAAPKDSFIVVDEPETHLNLSIVNRLWNLLQKEKQDSTFIFISHNVDFISSRINSEMIWCKEFNYPNEWKLEKIDNPEGLPKELVIELIGTKRPIIFCEGTKGKLDYNIYSKLFVETHIVKAVGGHRNIIEFVEAYSKSSFLLQNQKVFGIIDGDLNDDGHCFEKNNIKLLPFNEIEMFLLEDNVMLDVISNIYSKEIAETKIQSFKNEFIKKMEINKEKIVLEKIKKIVDTKLETEKINLKYKEFSKLKESLNELLKGINIEVDELKKNYDSQLSELIRNRDYQKLLVWCSLKEEVSKGLANKYLDKDYMNKAVCRIENSEELKKYLKETYFKEFI